MSLGDKVQERLKTPTIEEPKGQYGDLTEWDGSRGYIQTRGLEAPPSYDKLLRFFGYDPTEVKIVGIISQSRWQVLTRKPVNEAGRILEKDASEYESEDDVPEDYGDTHKVRWLTAYKFAIAPAATSGVDDLMKLINRKPPKLATGLHGDHVFHWLVGDLQLGKIDGDGTEGIVTRYLQSVQEGVARFRELQKKHGIGLVHLAWVGDCIEGNQSQGGKLMWRTNLTVTEQTRLFRRLALETIDAFLPYATSIEADVVNGNHDRVQEFVQTRMDDGHATEAMIALSDGLALNPERYGKVRIFVPNKDEGTLTRDVGGTMMTFAHGHQWNKGQQFKWWSEQALNNQSPGAASFLIHGHTHEFDVGEKRDRTYICVPTFEAESTYWRQRHGDVARPGAVTMLTRGREWSDLTIV